MAFEVLIIDDYCCCRLSQKTVHAGLYVNQLLAYNNSNPNPTEMMSSHIFLLDERSISNAPFHSVKPALGFFL
jgi:hypothetical protein